MTPAAPKQNLKRKFQLPHVFNPKFYLALVIPALVILSIVQMVASNRLATEGEDIRQIDRQKLQLTRENQELKNKIADQSSIAVLENRVKELKLKKIDHLETLTDPALARLP